MVIKCAVGKSVADNGWVLDAVGEIKAQKFILALPFNRSKIVDFGTFAPIAVQALVIGSP